MSVEEVDFKTVAYPSKAKEAEDAYWDTVDGSTSFRSSESDNVRTLSQYGTQQNSKIYGIIYVPDLARDDCKEGAVNFVPDNVIRRDDLPSKTHSLVALAPWFSAECTIDYLKATSGQPVAAFIFFRPDNTTDVPPTVNDRGWSLNDGGSWKKTYNFPVFAIPGSSGFRLLGQTVLYSGNVSQVPHGEDIVKSVPGTEFIRIGAEIRIGSKSFLPNLWVFLLIVASMLVVIVCSASAMMHLVQMKRRHGLRRRVRNGEVDLEALGVKRLTVPKSILDKLPLYTFDNSLKSLETPEKAIASNHTSYPVRFNITKFRSSNRLSPINQTNGTTSTGQPAFSQTHCSICLDDFSTSAEGDSPQQDDTQSSLVRELPCRHIFHPSCIDNFLLNNSSLCPVCKVSVLPKGFCDVRISNAMVRRERRLRQRANTVRADQNPRWHSPITRAMTRGFRAGAATYDPSNALGRSVSNAPPNHQRNRFSNATRADTHEVEMTDQIQHMSHQTPSQAPDPQRNIVEMGLHASVPAMQVATASSVVDADEEAQRARPWKRVYRRLFPI